jgi:hypothetical protein
MAVEVGWWRLWQNGALQRAIVDEALLLLDKRGTRLDGTPLPRSRR